MNSLAPYAVPVDAAQSVTAGASLQFLRYNLPAKGRLIALFLELDVTFTVAVAETVDDPRLFCTAFAGITLNDDSENPLLVAARGDDLWDLASLEAAGPIAHPGGSAITGPAVPGCQLLNGGITYAAGAAQTGRFLLPILALPRNLREHNPADYGIDLAHFAPGTQFTVALASSLTLGTQATCRATITAGTVRPIAIVSDSPPRRVLRTLVRRADASGRDFIVTPSGALLQAFLTRGPTEHYAAALPDRVFSDTDSWIAPQLGMGPLQTFERQNLLWRWDASSSAHPALDGRVWDLLGPSLDRNILNFPAPRRLLVTAPDAYTIPTGMALITRAVDAATMGTNSRRIVAPSGFGPSSVGEIVAKSNGQISDRLAASLPSPGPASTSGQ